MFGWTAPLGFVFGFVGSVPVAGPIAVLVLCSGLERRFRNGLGIAMGAAVAEGTYALLAFWGFGTLLSGLPWSSAISHGASASLLLVLGMHLLRRAGPSDEERESPSAPLGAESGGFGSGLVLGFGVTALNPTLIATWSMAITMLHTSELIIDSEGSALAFGAGAALGIGGWFAILLGLLYRYRERFTQGFVASSRRAAAWLVLGFGLYFAWLTITDLR
ncbi:MAG: LysE family transporter [Myxococcales bacterium]|nr:LysE family transporter [Myxococcales bacterium]